ncbi:Maf family protein [Rhodococcus sp. D-6]|uniref:Nucleoside triphosphate pyrophosphatase n=1 Tax=Rhodococcus sp. D-6 TaxID=1387842 RepID=A0AAU7USP0_9NOCA|nr:MULTISPECIES: Maf family protein [unclassified Rhodococcus (in: high G+C Gram-positive bacteria)]AOD23930.1 septum formation inhibitor Maf [Rhodococcus sp. p52]
MPRLVLASASPARLAVLHAAGVKPLVQVSEVDEDALIASLGPGTPPAQVVTELARAKATDILPVLREQKLRDAVVIGCDSMLLIDGALQGKPGTVEAARERWQAMAGRSGELLTGHAVLRLRDDEVVAEAADHSGTVVHFGIPTDEELEAYLDSGEPLEVAGAFTLDGHGGWFVEGIEGDPSSVIGIGLPLVRRLLAEVGISVARLWAENAAIPVEALEN